MKTFNIDTKEISVPNNWSEITLGQYEDWTICEATTTENYNNSLAKICNITPPELANIPQQLASEIKEHLQFIFDGYSEKSAASVIDGTTYTISSKKDLIVAEWLYLEELNKEQNPLFSEILAIVCRPIGEKFEDEKLSLRSTFFKNQTCDTIFPLINYFLYEERQSREVLKQTLQTIDDTKEFLETLKEFEAEGDGVKHLSYLQRKRYTHLVKSLENQLDNL